MIQNLDPFLLLDEAKFSKPSGFPDHPHRGFETVSYVLKGALEHRDFAGHHGIIHPGDLQWMTAGRGVVHSEMPYCDGENHGLQLWINLKRAHKLEAPNYQELTKDKIPEVTRDGITVRILAGESMGTKSEVFTRTPCMYLHFTVSPGSSHKQAVPTGWTAFIYILNGELVIGPDEKVGEVHHLVVLSKGDSVEFSNKGQSPCEFILVAGEPIGEPIARSGPFVMTTQAELQQAYTDYQLGQNGFENRD